MTSRSFAPSPAMSAMTFCSFGLRTTSSRSRSTGFFARADDGAPLALEPPEQRVGEAPHEHVVARAVALAREELAPRRPARPRAASRAGSWRETARSSAPGRATRSSRRRRRRRWRRASPALRDQTNTWGTSRMRRPVGPPRRCTSSSARIRWSPSILPRARPSSRCLGRLRKSAALAAGGDGALDVRRVALGRARAERVEPAAPHRLEQPEPQVVREADLGQVVALGEVVEREEVDERQVAQDVDDRPARVRLAHRARPGLVDLDALEEAVGTPTRAAGSDRTRRADGRRSWEDRRSLPSERRTPAGAARRTSSRSSR